MLDLKIEDVDMRYVLFTLNEAARNLGIKKETANRLLLSMHFQLRDNDMMDNKGRLPEYITSTAINETGTRSLEEFFEEKLIAKSDNGYVKITDKAKRLLNTAAKKQQEMIESGFSYSGGVFVANPAIFYSNIIERP